MKEKKNILYAVVCITDRGAEQVGNYDKDINVIQSKIKELNCSNTDNSKIYGLLTVWDKE